MLKRMMPSLVVATLGIGVVAGMWWIGGGSTLAREDPGCSERDVGGPFMGMADPDAPYDLRFIDEMIMHHQGAIMSAEMMIEDSERPELRDLAQRIQESQQRQVAQMREWRAQWYPDAPAPAMDMEPMGDMMSGGMMDGMMSGGGMMSDGGMMGMMMGGERIDRMFLRMMIPHHQLAVEMGEDALQRAEHQALKGLAEEIIQGQSAEIEEMERYLQDWYGVESTRDAAGGMQDMMHGMMGGC
ncbi:MAG TPA: DUF305 domain-containing protein [Thermomicrobiales bacterium]|nr:DUF305 domain-containing protein [Thermomicrobiales bacterium]